MVRLGAMTTADGILARKAFMLGLTYTSPESQAEWETTMGMNRFKQKFKPLLDREYNNIVKQNVRGKEELNRYLYRNKNPDAEEQRGLLIDNIENKQQERLDELFQIYNDNYRKGVHIAQTVIATKQTPEEKGVAIDKAFDDFLSDRNSNLDGGRKRRRTRRTRRRRV